MLRSTADLLDTGSLESFCEECLVRSFCNHIYFGQWHLAEASSAAHKLLKSGHLTEIAKLLRRITENPYGSRYYANFKKHKYASAI